MFERENKFTADLLPKPAVGRRKKKKLVKKLRGAKKKNYLRRFVRGRNLAEIARVHYRINFFKFKKKKLVKKLRGAKKKNYLRRFVRGRNLAEIARVHYRINFFKFKKRLRRKKKKRNFLYYDSFSHVRALQIQKMQYTPALFDIVVKKNCLYMLKREGFFFKKHAIARGEDSEEFEFYDAHFAA